MKRTIGRLAVIGATGALALGGLLAAPAGATARTTVVDRDRDAMPDAWEVSNHLDTHRNDAAEDPDHDGVGNVNEWRLHSRAHDSDTDDDGSDDGDERRDRTRPDVADTDHDGIRDGNEDRDHDGIRNEDEDDATEACLGDDADRDHDGVSDEDEDDLGLKLSSADSDRDGIRDGSEDRDRDGVLNEDEDDHGTDRCVRDSDHDGRHDEDEDDLFGTITSFDATTSVLTVTGPTGVLTGKVTSATRIRFEDDSDEATTSGATTAREAESGGGSGSGGSGGSGGGSTATTADLVPGAEVSEIEAHGGLIDHIDLVQKAAAPAA